MKNRTSILVRTHYFFYALLVAVVLQSCGDGVQFIDWKDPLIVCAIIKYNKTDSKYFTTNGVTDRLGHTFTNNLVIILPSGSHQIGDTIKFEFNTHIK